MSYNFTYTSEWDEDVAIWFRYAIVAFYRRNNPKVHDIDVMMIIPRMREPTPCGTKPRPTKTKAKCGSC